MPRPARPAVKAALAQAAMFHAASVVAGFNGITHIADATDMPLDPAIADETQDGRVLLTIDRIAALKL